MEANEPNNLSPLGLGARWVWPAGLDDRPNRIVQFRQIVHLDASGPGSRLHLAADGAYAAWLNGRLVGVGPWPSWPGEKTYDTWDITEELIAGGNVLAVCVVWWGEGHFSYVPDAPGLIAALQTHEASFTTGTDTQWRLDPCYRSGPIERISPQLPFTFDVDARGEDHWRTSPQPMPGWAAISQADIDATAQPSLAGPRPVETLRIGPALPGRIVAQGCLRRTQSPEPLTIAQLMQQDFLSARTPQELFDRADAPVDLAAGPVTIPPPPQAQADGSYLVVDLAAEQVGLLQLDLDAPAGCVIDIAWGEHLDDLRVRAHVGGRNFAGRYRTRQGPQQFTHPLLRIAGRYLQLHLIEQTGPVTLRTATLLPTNYPLPETTPFHCSDRLLEILRELADRTLRLSVHDHYEDCPWREQGLYANDSRNQMLAGYYAFGEWAMPAASLVLFGPGLDADGYVSLCAPVGFDRRIPSFSFAWVQAAWEHALHAGTAAWRDGQDRDRALQIARAILKPRLDELDKGCLPTPLGPDYWNFYDWADGLDGTGANDCTQFESLDGQRFDAPLNALLGLALQAGAKLFEVDDPAFAAKLSAAREDLAERFHETFWDDDRQLYRSFQPSDDKPHFAQLTQAVAVLAGLVPSEYRAGLLQKLAGRSDDLVPATLSQSLYVHQALLSEADAFGQSVFEDLRQRWGAMVRQGATTFWETERGPWDFGRAGSCCHGWSATPAFLLGAHLLGVRPLKPGFAEFTLDPVRNIVPEAFGEVPTPHGPIDVHWQKIPTGLRFEVRCPDACNPVLPEPTRGDELTVMPENSQNHPVGREGPATG